MADQASLKAKILRGDTVIGVAADVSSTRSQLEDILSKDTYDFIHADAQHSPYNEESLVSFCETTNELGVPVQFRIKHTRLAYLVGNVLDLGPLGVEVPLVEEESVVDEAVDWFYYPQVGRRSFGGAARYGVEGREGRLEYAEWWNANGILCIQLETLRAVTNARQLAKRGVTCFTWGPGDLGFDIERHPHHPLKSLDDCVRHVQEQIQGLDTKISIRTNPDRRDYYREMGVNVFMERPMA